MLNYLLVLLLSQVDQGLPIHRYEASNDEVIINYDPMTKNPRFVVEYLDSKILTKNVARTYNPFKADESLPKFIKVYPQDYIGSGYDRGHMAPAGNHMSSKNSFEFTFFMTNMTPQLPEVNRYVWKELEASIRINKDLFDSCWVVTCPIYGSDEDRFHIDKVSRLIWVPTHLGKSVLFAKQFGNETKYSLQSYIVPNKVGVLKDYPMHRVTTDELESRTGLDLWSKFPVEKLESVP